jgi:hypothetical protein
MIDINILSPHPDDIAEGDASFTAWHTTNSITRAYHWHGKGNTAASAAQDCLDKINDSRIKINPEAKPYTLGEINGTTATCIRH